jgi:hypothetical protein
MDQLETADYTVYNNDLFLSDINPTNIYLDQNIQEFLTTLLHSTPKANAAILKVMHKDDIQIVRDLGRYSDTWLLNNANQEIVQPIYRIKFNAIVKHIHILLEEEVPHVHGGTVEESQGSDYDPKGGEISLAKSFGKSSSDSDESEEDDDDENEGEGDNVEDDTSNSNGRKYSMTSSQSVMVHFARHAGSHSPIPQLLNVPEDNDEEQQHHEQDDNEDDEEEEN